MLIGKQVTIRLIDGRTYVDVVELIRAIQAVAGNQILTSALLDRLWEMDEIAQRGKQQ